jgi:hypothetical protein
MARSRKATVADIAEIALGLPQVEESAARGGRPAYQVGGRTFVFFREPRKDAVDADTGERMADVVGFRVPDAGVKDALVQSDGPWFTTPHFDGYDAVLLRERDIGGITVDELREVITDGWLSRAPKRLAKEFLAKPPA